MYVCVCVWAFVCMRVCAFTSDVHVVAQHWRDAHTGITVVLMRWICVSVHACTQVRVCQCACVCMRVCRFVCVYVRAGVRVHVCTRARLPCQCAW